MSGAVAASVASAGTSAVAEIPVAFDQAITFDEYPFPPAATDAGIVVQGPGGSSVVSYNLFDDTTGAPLASDNGDLDDLTFIYEASPGGASAPGNRPDLRFRQSGAVRQITSRTSYSTAPGSNNPGTRQFVEVRVNFAAHLDVREVSLVVSSFNTAGNAWEFSTVQFLDGDGAEFSAAPLIPAHQEHGAGTSGSTGLGTFVWASTGTVNGVGTDSTSAGVSGPGDGVMTLTHAATGLSGQRIGGFVWRTTLEDVRGVNNGTSVFTSSLRSIRLAGSVTRLAIADVGVEKTASPASVVQGDSVSYGVEVTNYGPEPAFGVVVTDTLPTGLSFAGVVVPAGWSCLTPDIGSTGTVLCAADGPLAPGSADLRIDVTVDDDAPVGEITNSVAVDASSEDSDASNNEGAVVIQVSPVPTTTMITTTTSTTTTTTDVDDPTTSTTGTVGPTTIPTSAPATTTYPVVATTVVDAGSRLARTGFGLGSIVWWGLFLVGTGAAVAFAVRRAQML